MDGPVVVGTDGSKTATSAVLAAIELAKRFGQPLHIVSAYHQQALRSEGVPSEFDFQLTSAASVDSLLDDVASRARVAGVKVETHAAKGDAADAIIDVAARLNAGVIVVGNKGIGSMRRFILGNVPTKVVHNAPCSTYVVHTT
jgi:nucleotide-binding universal stress UspA family protein